MSKLAQTLRDFIAIIPAERPFALVGGLAISARTEPRFTKDIDLALAARNDLEAEDIVFRAQQAGFFVAATIEQRSSGRLATARLRRDPQAPFVDLLFAACGIEQEVTADAEILVVRTTRVPVATVGHLIAMKLVSRDDKRRPDDRGDLVKLARAADAREWARAEVAVHLIEERGFARKRDLRAALAEWRAQAHEL